MPIAPSRATRVIALDDAAADVVRRVAEGSWNTARFYSCLPGNGGDGPEGTDSVAGLRLLTTDGNPGNTVPLVGELEGVDATVMVATSDAGAEAASTIGAACTVRGISTAGLILVEGALVSSPVGDALSALRPHARVLLVPADEEDLVELLRAIRA